MYIYISSSVVCWFLHAFISMYYLNFHGLFLCMILFVVYVVWTSVVCFCACFLLMCCCWFLILIKWDLKRCCRYSMDVRNEGQLKLFTKCGLTSAEIKAGSWYNALTNPAQHAVTRNSLCSTANLTFQMQVCVLLIWHESWMLERVVNNQRLGYYTGIIYEYCEIKVKWAEPSFRAQGVGKTLRLW